MGERSSYESKRLDGPEVSEVNGADKCRANGWGPGTGIADGETVLTITAVGRSIVLAERSDSAGYRGESLWDLTMRDWAWRSGPRNEPAEEKATATPSQEPGPLAKAYGLHQAAAPVTRKEFDEILARISSQGSWMDRHHSSLCDHESRLKSAEGFRAAVGLDYYAMHKRTVEVATRFEESAPAFNSLVDKVNTLAKSSELHRQRIARIAELIDGDDEEDGIVEDLAQCNADIAKVGKMQDDCTKRLNAIERHALRLDALESTTKMLQDHANNISGQVMDVRSELDNPGALVGNTSESVKSSPPLVEHKQPLSDPLPTDHAGPGETAEEFCARMGWRVGDVIRHQLHRRLRSWKIRWEAKRLLLKWFWPVHWLCALLLCGGAWAGEPEEITTTCADKPVDTGVIRFRSCNPPNPIGCCWAREPFVQALNGAVSQAWTRPTTRIVYLPRLHPTRWLVWLPSEIPVVHGVDCEDVIK